MLAGYLRRGLVAGLLAGLLAGLVALALGEPPLEHAIRLEDAVTRAGPSPHAVTVPRGLQQGGLVVALLVVGCSLGGLFGAVYAAVRPRLGDTSAWAASLRIGVAGWAALALLPSLKYPASPPGAGDPATVGARTGWYLAMVVLSVIVVTGAWTLHQRLQRRGAPPARRQLAAAALVVAGSVLVATVLPTRPPVGDLPAELVWDLRLAAIGVHAALWSALAVGFGLLQERALRQRAA